MDDHSTTQKLFAEALGTATLVFIGVGSVPATKLIGGDAPPSMATLGVISFAFGTTVVAMVYALGHISGCQINPAVTLALAATRRMPWSEVPGYLAAQCLGAVAGALAIVGVLGQPAVAAGLGIASYGPTIGLAQAFFAEAIGTFLLVFMVFGAISPRAPRGFAGLAIGLAVFAIILPIAPITGAAINPARAFGPLLVGQLFGGSVAWAQLPVYLVAEVLGGLAASITYLLLTIRRRTPATSHVPPSTTATAEGALS